MRRTLALAIILGAAWAAVAAADGGGGSPGVDLGSYGVVSPSGKVRYLTLPAGQGTLVEAMVVRGGHVLRSSFLRGAFGIPFVAVDSSTGGLARNGRRLVLASAYYGRRAPASPASSCSTGGTCACRRACGCEGPGRSTRSRRAGR